MMTFLKTIFRPIGKAISWIAGGDDEKLRAARARGKITGEVTETARDDSKGQVVEQTEIERYTDEFDVWEEIDSYRTTFWFGSKMGRMMSRSRKRGDKLEKELDELERKRQAEKREKGEG